MRFTTYTLIDITETGCRRGEDPTQYRQQQNFLTVMQTIGLRVNPTYVMPPETIKEIPSKIGLGTSYKTKQTIWKYTFDVDYEGALDVQTLENDFDLIPVIGGLNETVVLDMPQFITKNTNKTNIIFILSDK